MYKLTDNDKTFGPFTWGKSAWDAIRLYYDVIGVDGDGEAYPGGQAYNRLVVHLSTWGTLGVALPCFIQPQREKITPLWDEETIHRLGRNYYVQTKDKMYGISLSHGNFLEVFYGVQTDEGETTQHWCTHLPWQETRLVRYQFFDDQDRLYWSDRTLEGKPSFAPNPHIKGSDAREACPSVDYLVLDGDGTLVVVKTRVIEYQWSRGTGWFKWLSWFTKDTKRRTLDLSFAQEVGPSKGSWKGGMTGHSVEILPGETRLATMNRYCAKPHTSRDGEYMLTFVKKI